MRRNETVGAIQVPFFFLNPLNPVRNITRAAFLIAVNIILGYLFLAVPNIELITAGIFISGIWMGPKYGLFIGLIAETIFSVTNPMGFPPPPLLISQIIAMSFTGFIGGLMGKTLLERTFFNNKDISMHILLALIGSFLTFLYDLITNLSFPLTAGFSSEQVKISLLMGIPFAAIHIVVNAASFALLVPAVISRVKLWRRT